MSRVLILLTFVFWLAWRPGYPFAPWLPASLSLPLFFGMYSFVVLGTALWARRLARHLDTPNLPRSLARLNRVMVFARVFIPAWFIVGMFFLGWPGAVQVVFDRLHLDLSQTVLGVIVGTAPAFAAWAGLWWSQYPADVAFREQSVSSYLENDLPLHKPTPFKGYFAANLRLQLLFVMIPVLLICLMHDLLRLAATLSVGNRYELNNPDNPLPWLLAAGFVFLFAPEILRRVLHTEPLPNSPLRRRLESLCRRTGVRYREILLWRTENNIGNAAVMGFVPQFRYILLSDLLIESMTDEQIEAVFAHELGHVVHRHMAWLMVFFAVLTLFIIGCGAWISHWMTMAGLQDGPAQGIVVSVAYLLKFLLLFGFVSRRFERQADVFAARTMELTRQSVPDVSASEMLLAARRLSLASAGAPATTALAISPVRTSDTGHVGKYGAAVFGSALQQVAIVNNIPVRARSWCHGSIDKRMQYIRQLSDDPQRTARFDRFMLFLYGALVFGLFAGAAFCWASNALP